MGSGGTALLDSGLDRAVAITLPCRGMKVLIWVGCAVLVLIFLLIAGFIALAIRAARVTAARDKALDEKIAPALGFLRDGSSPDLEWILRLARDPLTRNRCFAALEAAGRGELFPEQYRKPESIAESDLVRWLAHGNELGSAPARIELVCEQDVESEGRQGKVYLFRFRVDESHWAADKEWMAGVSGPFWDGDRSSDSGQL